MSAPIYSLSDLGAVLAGTRPDAPEAWTVTVQPYDAASAKQRDGHTYVTKGRKDSPAARQAGDFTVGRLAHIPDRYLAALTDKYPAECRGALLAWWRSKSPVLEMMTSASIGATITLDAPGDFFTSSCLYGMPADTQDEVLREHAYLSRTVNRALYNAPARSEEDARRMAQRDVAKFRKVLTAAPTSHGEHGAAAVLAFLQSWADIGLLALHHPAMLGIARNHIVLCLQDRPAKATIDTDDGADML